MGKIDLAKKFIDISKKFCDLKYVKFQKDIPKPYYQKKNIIHPILFLKIRLAKHMASIEKC